MISWIKNKLKNIVRTAILKSFDDNGVNQMCKVTSLGTERKAMYYTPYGLCSYPEKGNSVVMQVGAKEDRLMAFVWNPKRPKMKKGDVGLFTGKITLMIHKDGKIEIKGASEDLVKLVGKLGDYTQDIITKLSATTVATAIGPSPLSTQADWLNMLLPANPDNIIGLVQKIHDFEV